MSETAADSGSYYAKHEKIHAREVEGRFATLRRAAVITLLGLYYLLPWLTWDGRQAVLFNLPARKFYIFGLVFWPQDFFFLSWLLIMAALLLFFVTSIAGRLWCGYACPQTVWTEIFVWMERLAEGPFARRIKLDRGPWTGEKILRKTAKQVLWVSFALWTGITFVGYFTPPITDLVPRMFSFQLGPWETFWIFFYGLATYGNAGYLREQVCKYMCPYARFQSAMFDHDTLIVSYDTARGEPRGGRKRGVASAAAGLGDCVDCNMCVQACPTGIDIRKGLQYECIACASCVDACDTVMDRMGYARGLVRYTTERSLASGDPPRVLRTRTFIYGTLLACLFVGFIVALFNRSPVTLDVIRDRNALYREIDEDTVQNVFTLKVLNKSDQARRFHIEVEGLPGVELAGDATEPELAGGAVGSFVVEVNAPRRGESAGGHDIKFRVSAVDEPALHATHRARFMFPAGGHDEDDDHGGTDRGHEEH